MKKYLLLPAVLTGDTLFLGDVGGPDLSKTHTPTVLRGCFMTACITNCAPSQMTLSFIPRTEPVEGFRNVAEVIGGFDAWENARLPFLTKSPVAV